MAFCRSIEAQSGTSSYGNGSFGSATTSTPKATPQPAPPAEVRGDQDAAPCQAHEALGQERRCRIRWPDVGAVRGHRAVADRSKVDGPRTKRGLQAQVDDGHLQRVAAVGSRRRRHRRRGRQPAREPCTGESRTVPEVEFHAKPRMTVGPFEDYDRLAQLGLGGTLRTIPGGSGAGGGGGRICSSSGLGWPRTCRPARGNIRSARAQERAFRPFGACVPRGSGPGSPKRPR